MDFDSYARRLWAGRADAYEHGFARLTVHAVGALLDAELRRVLRAGGRLALTCWSEPPPPVLGIAREALEAAGVSWPPDISVPPWEFRVDPQEWWQVYRSSVGSSGAVIARQDDATIERIKGEFGSLAARYATGDGAVALPASAVLASGTRP